MYRPYLWSNAILSLYIVQDFAKQPSKTPLTVVNESPLELLWRHIHCYVSVYVIRFPLVFDLLQSRHFFLCHKGYQYETQVWLVSLDTSFFSTQKIPCNAFWISIHNLLLPTTKRKQQVVEIKFSLIPKPKFKMHADL